MITRLLLVALVCTALCRAALPLHTQPGSPFDLAVTGKLAGVPSGETRYVSWDDLRALPTSELDLPNEYGKGPRKVRVVFLSDLRRALPSLPEADCLLATCKDLYASVYTDAFIQAYKPFLVLEIDGKGPKDWPPAGLKYNPGPYAITVSTALAPAAKDYLDLLHKKPTQVTSLQVATYREAFGGAWQGAWASLSGPAEAGRTIWINSCASCHPGPNGTFGGTKSQMPFLVVTSIAAYSPALFRQYVRDPKSVAAAARMEAHPHYTDQQLADLIAFITAGSPKAAAQ